MSATHTPGPWMVATSNSWRRIVAQGMTSVCEPIKQNDGHQDLYFRNGGADGPDALLIVAAPDLLEACKALILYDESDDSDGLEFMQRYADAVDKARAAIAKATGGTA